MTQNPERKKGAKSSGDATITRTSINMHLVFLPKDIQAIFTFNGAVIKLEDLMSPNLIALLTQYIWGLEQFKNTRKFRKITESSFTPAFIEKKVQPPLFAIIAGSCTDSLPCNAQTKEAKKDQEATKGPKLYKDGVRRGIVISSHPSCLGNSANWCLHPASLPHADQPLSNCSFTCVARRRRSVSLISSDHLV